MFRLCLAILTLVAVLGASPVHAQEAGADTTRTYTVQDGDTLYRIARTFSTSVRRLMRWNDLNSPSIQVGQTLVVRPPNTSPQDSPPDETPSEQTESEEPDPSEVNSEETEPEETEPENTEPERIEPEDTGAETPSPDDTSTSAAGDTSATVETAPPPPGRTTIRPGDTLIDLALRYGTTADTLYALNDSTRAPLPSGRKVLLPPRFAPPTYVVKRGDTLYRIAGEYGVSVRSLKETNALDTTALRPGQRLRIPGRSAPEASGAAPADTTGPVSLFPSTFAGRLTASGEPYDPDAFVASHPSLPYGSVILLSYEDTRSHAFARIVDRGPVDDNALLEVSDAVAQQLGLDPDSNSPVQLRVVWVERP